MVSRKFRMACGRCAAFAGAIAVAGLGGCVVQPLPGFAYIQVPRIVVYQPPPPAVAEVPSPAQPAPAAPAQESSDADLQKLVAPVALYPDPLLAETLTASTYPEQIAAAAQWLQENPNATDGEIAAQSWDPSVAALVHYPTVLNYMNAEIGWTQSLGAAVSTEQPDVMAAVQDLRVQAYNDGNLQNTPQQRILVVGDPVIYILPVEPGAIYVPTYDPVLVYRGTCQITFGASLVAGPWLVHGFDWDNHRVYYGDWHGGWIHDQYGWHSNPHWGPGYYRPWVRDGRWGPAPRVDRYRFLPEVERGPWHGVEPTHRDEVRDLRRRGEIPRMGREDRPGFGGPRLTDRPDPQNRLKGQPKFAMDRRPSLKNIQPQDRNETEKKKS